MSGFDPASLLINLIVSSIGLAFFMYGKKAERWPQLVAGVALMAYPYLVSTAIALFGIGVLILIAMSVALWLGW